MRLHLLVLDGVFDLGLAALTDTLSTANELAGSLAQTPTPIEVTLVGVRRRVRTAQGLTVPVVPVHCVRTPDVVLVPALGAKMPDTLPARLARPDVADAVVAFAPVVKRRRGRRRCLHWHLRTGGERAAQRSARHDFMVAGADVSAALSARGA